MEELTPLHLSFVEYVYTPNTNILYNVKLITSRSKILDLKQLYFIFNQVKKKIKVLRVLPSVHLFCWEFRIKIANFCTVCFCSYVNKTIVSSLK